ncbi:MAG: NAD(P)/FAD-dependent oxidoreductase [Anaerolineales bacterium]|uniref:NAD(P)/FAD-dependent oxidoreductase n=1 Tax=Candidatus Villigracilis proximus TaxID=3140683 RepID=UPI003134FFDB|nr:NAD(P)/FAD-dependent oxidoreductase [Anaerolineales bacterium]
MRYVIIGAGVAGYAAIEAIRSVDRVGEIIMISDDPHGYYSRPGLAYYLTGELQDKALYPRTLEDYKKIKFSFHKCRVTRILRSEHALEIEGKPQLTYDKLLIAVGARALPLKVPGSKLDGVVKLDHLTDAQNILKLAKSGKTAVVVGGGITALELTEGLLARGMKVHYLLRGDRYWSNVLDQRESKVVEGRLQAEGVELHYHAELKEIVGKKNRVSAILLENGQTIKCDMLAYAIGIHPCLELVQNTDLNVDRGILVDEHLQTNDPDIYAAGDVAQAFDPLSGRAVLDSLWNPAREQGQVAGMNMAGRKTAYLKSAPFNVTRLAGLTTTIIGTVGRGRDEDIVGIARGDSETWRDMPDAIAAQSGFDINHMRLMIGEKTLIGAIVMGDQTLSWPLQKMIAGGADISPIREKLMEPEPPVADLIADFWIKWREKVSL